MKTLLFGLMLSASFFTSVVKGQTENVLEEIIELGLPVVQITTVDGEEPTCDYVWAPHIEGQVSIANATKVPGRLMVYRGGLISYDSGEYEKGISGMTLKIHGNSSAYADKKPYKIKLQKKADLLQRDGDKDYRDKNWLLLKDGDTSINTFVGLAVSRAMGMSWTPAAEYVNVIVNGQYRGLYMLIEQVRRNTDCRIDVSKNGGFIVEYDPYWWNEDTYVESDRLFIYTFKYPEDEDLTQEKQQSILGQINYLEETFPDNYDQVIDVSSWTRWLMAHDILGTSDWSGSNLFLAKYDVTSGSLFFMPCLWDFDSNRKQVDQFASIHNEWYFPLLIHSSNTLFNDTYVMLWRQNEERIFASIENELDYLENSPLGQALQRSRQKDNDLWDFPVNPSTISEDVALNKAWFAHRKKWMAKAVDRGLDVKIIEIKITTEHQLYDLQGRQSRQPLYPGVYILDGRKLIRH